MKSTSTCDTSGHLFSMDDITEAWGIDEGIFSLNTSPSPGSCDQSGDEVDFSKYSNIDINDFLHPSAPPFSISPKIPPPDPTHLEDIPFESLSPNHKVNTFKKLLQLSSQDTAQIVSNATTLADNLHEEIDLYSEETDIPVEHSKANDSSITENKACDNPVICNPTSTLQKDITQIIPSIPQENSSTLNIDPQDPYLSSIQTNNVTSFFEYTAFQNDHIEMLKDNCATVSTIDKTILNSTPTSSSISDSIDEINLNLPYENINDGSPSQFLPLKVHFDSSVKLPEQEEAEVEGLVANFTACYHTEPPSQYESIELGQGQEPKDLSSFDVSIQHKEESLLSEEEDYISIKSSDSNTESQGLIDTSRVYPSISFFYNPLGSPRGIYTFPYPQIRVVRDLSLSVYFKAILYRPGSLVMFDNLSLQKERELYFSSNGLFLSSCSELASDSESEKENEMLCRMLLLGPLTADLNLTRKALDTFSRHRFFQSNSLFSVERKLFCNFLAFLLESPSNGDAKCLQEVIGNLSILLYDDISSRIRTLKKSLPVSPNEDEQPTTAQTQVNQLERLNLLLLGEIEKDSSASETQQLELMRFCLDRPVLLVLFGSSSSAARSLSFISQIGSIIKEQFPDLNVEEWLPSDVNNFGSGARSSFLELVFRAYLIYDQCALAVELLSSVCDEDFRYIQFRWPFILLHAFQIRPPWANCSLYLQLAKIFLAADLAWASQLLIAIALISYQDRPAQSDGQTEPISEFENLKRDPIVLFHDLTIEPLDCISLQSQRLFLYVGCIFLHYGLKLNGITMDQSILERERFILIKKWSETTGIKIETNHHQTNTQTATASPIVVGPKVLPIVPEVDECPMNTHTKIEGVMIPESYPATRSFKSTDSSDASTWTQQVPISYTTTAIKVQITADDLQPVHPLFNFSEVKTEPLHEEIATANFNITPMQKDPIVGSHSAEDWKLAVATPVAEEEKSLSSARSSENESAGPIAQEVGRVDASSFGANPSLLTSLKNFFSTSREILGSRRKRADLGMSNELIFDKELGQWINPNLPRPEPIKVKPPPTIASIKAKTHIGKEEEQRELLNFEKSFSTGPSNTYQEWKEEEIPSEIMIAPLGRKGVALRKKYVDPFNLSMASSS